MHPFALNDEVLDQVGGAGNSSPIDPPFASVMVDAPPPPETTLRLGEEGGWFPPPGSDV